MIEPMKRALFLTAAVSLFACSPAPAQQTGGGDTAARVGDRVITAKELDDRWQALDPAGHAEAAQKMYDGKRSALDAIVAETLIAQAAKAKNMSAEDYEAAELKTRTKPVGESDVVTFYQSNINQMQGRSLEVMAPAIRRYLQDQQSVAARASLIADLRKAGPEVRVLFDAPRHTIEVTGRRSVDRTGICAGDARRVLGLPVSFLPARRADAQAGEAEVRRQGSRGVEGLPAHADSPAGVQGR